MNNKTTNACGRCWTTCYPSGYPVEDATQLRSNKARGDKRCLVAALTFSIATKIQPAIQLSDVRHCPASTRMDFLVKPVNEGTAKHELEGGSVLDLGCVTKSHKTALLCWAGNSHAQTCASPLIFTGAATEELATSITSFVDDMLEWNLLNKSRSCVTLHSDIPNLAQGANLCCLVKTQSLKYEQCVSCWPCAVISTGRNLGEGEHIHLLRLSSVTLKSI